MRAWSVPERLGGFGLAVAAAAPLYATVQQATGWGVSCPLRLLTGVPCPVCGTTTAVLALADGNVPAALTANPFVLVPAATAAVGVLLLAARTLRLLGPPTPWSPRARRHTYWLAAALATVSWLFQLHRFALLDVPGLDTP